jgi:hypothetical protein
MGCLEEFSDWLVLTNHSLSFLPPVLVYPLRINKIFLINKEIQMGPGAKSYMRKGFLIVPRMLIFHCAAEIDKPRITA